MITLYALVVSICLSNGLCEALSPEVYEDLTQCVMEAAHQRAQGIHSYCEEKHVTSLKIDNIRKNVRI